jgi:hypothetical protein
MAEEFESQSSAPTVGQSDSLIAGKDITFYWKTCQLFVVFLVILEIVAIVINQTRLGVWIAVALVAVIYTWWLLRRWHIRLTTALFANAMLGVLAGLVMAVFEIIWYRQWWYALNLIRLPLMLGAAAIIAGFIFYIIFQSIIIKNTIKESKGGGMYGGTKI